MAWSKEEKPLWDDDKQRIIGDNEGSFNIYSPQLNGELPGIWFKITLENEQVIGYGWIIYENEISIAVDKNYQGSGYGTQVIENLFIEASNLKITQVIAVVRKENPNATDVVKWAYKNGLVCNWPGLGELSVDIACKYVKIIDITLIKDIF